MSQFTLLAQKDLLLEKPRIALTSSLLLLPGLLTSLLLLTAFNYKAVSSPTIRDSFQASTMLPANLIPPKTLKRVSERDSLSAIESLKWKLVYSPNTLPAADRMANKMAQMLHMTPMGISLTLPLGLVTTLCLKKEHQTHSSNSVKS